MDHLSRLPDELLVFLLLIYLDVPDWQQLSKVSHRFRALVLDPRLHKSRLVLTSHWLSTVILNRPSSMDLYRRNILLSPLRLSPAAEPRITDMLRTLPHRQSRDLLARALANRPSKQELTERGLVPKNLEMGPNAAKIVKSLERRRLENSLEVLIEHTLQANSHALPVLKTSLSSNTYVDADVRNKETNRRIQRRTSFRNGNSGTSVVVVKRRKYSMIFPDQHLLPVHSLRQERSQNTFTVEPNSEAQIQHNSQSLQDQSDLLNQQLRDQQSNSINSSNGSVTAIEDPAASSETSRRKIQQFIRQDALLREDQQEEYFIRKSVHALASMYTFTTSWLSQPPPPKAPPLPLWSSNKTNTNGQEKQDVSISPSSSCFIDSRLMVPLTPYFNLTTDISTASRSVKVDSIKRKFENLAMEQTKESRRSKSLPSENTKSRNGFGSGLNAHACDANPFGSAGPSNMGGSRLYPLSRTHSASSLSSLASSASATSLIQRPLSRQCTGIAQGAVATLRQHFISLSC